MALRHRKQNSGTWLTDKRVVLPQLLKDRAILTISSRSRSNSKNLSARILLDPKYFLFLLPVFVVVLQKLVLLWQNSICTYCLTPLTADP